MRSEQKPAELQCPCEMALHEKKTVEYNFGLLGIKKIKVCSDCLKIPPYNQFIISVEDDAN